jgi:ribosome-associated translation inhibitor RaiA
MADYEFQGLALPEQMWEAFGAEITQGGKVRFARDGERAAVISAIERARGEADRKEAAIDVARRALRIRAADKPAEAYQAVADALHEIAKKLGRWKYE